VDNSSPFAFVHWPWIALKLLALLVAIGAMCVLMVAALYVVVEVAKKYPWSALGAAPMVAAYAWAIWGNTPGQWWRLGIALGIQAGTLIIASVVA